MPAVSVIIPCFNAARTLPLQLKALFTQLDAPEFEIIVVDNRSTDELSALIARTTAPDGVTLRLVEAHEHVGAAYTRNVGVSEARSDRLMFCDADDAVSQWWIAHGLRTFEEDDLWSGSCIPLSGEQFAQGLDAIRRAIGDNPDWVPPVPENDHTAFPILMGGNFGITRDLMLRLGGFDANAPAGGEDNDLGIRAQRAGSRVITCKATLLGYRQRMDPAALARNASNAARACCPRHPLRPLGPLALPAMAAGPDPARARRRAHADPPPRSPRVGGAAAACRRGVEPLPRQCALSSSASSARARRRARPQERVTQMAPLQPGTTVIVVAYNHEAFIDDCLDSIRAQTRQPAQVLIGDDCSPGDDTAGAIRRWCERHPGFAEFHPNPQNLGLNRTLNRLLAMVSTEFVTYIAADDLMRSDRIEVHEDLLRAVGSDVPLAYSDAAVIDGDDNDLGLSSTEFPWPPEPQRSTQTLEELVSRNWIPAASIFLRTAALRERGGYCEDIFFEDFELLTRLARHDAFAYSEAPLVTVRRLETSLGAVGFDPTSPRFIRAQYVSLTNALGKSDALDQRVLRILWELAIRARAVGVPWREALGMTLRAQRGAPSLKAKLFRTASALIPRR